MKIFNTQTRKKEDFIPQKAGEYRIYVCGPTVYNFIHVGNARPVCVFDTLRRYLEYTGNKVLYVQNVTDIDDKVIKRAAEEGKTATEIARKYENEYITDCEGLNVLKPTVQPRATEHIDEILNIIKDIIDKGHGYVAKNGDVYFRTKSFNEYGKLSHLVLEDLQGGNRNLQSNMDNDLKEDPTDFAVWKAAKPGEPAWESPYSMGRPGWHIECSAMARKHLGKTIDLHCGGQDLIFPHHENEIAQSECANGCTFSNYWMHNEFLNINNHKMSKSANNFFTVRDVANAYGYEAIRYFLISGHYRSQINYTVEVIEGCKASCDRLYTCRDKIDFCIENGSGNSDTLIEKCAEAKQKFITAMDDDLNTPAALAAIFELVKEINTSADSASKTALQACGSMMDELTSVLGIMYNRNKDEIPAEVKQLAEARTKARAEKNWAAADEIRDKLAALGYAVEDTPAGIKIVKK
ncbi:MAG: cysteine--tRNA ligase [Oscillospiraceae bacterium]